MNSQALQELIHRAPEPGALGERVEALEDFRRQAETAVDQLVTGLLDERGARQADLTSIAGHLESFAAGFQDLMRRIDTERINADLAHTSRIHPKAATIVFVCGHAFGCNLKYAWLEARARADELGWDVWFLPRDEGQEQLARQLSAQVFPAQHDAWSAQHVQRALSAAVVVLNDHFLHPHPHAAALLAGARQVQLWHGVSIKELGLQDLPDGKGLTRHRVRTLATSGPFQSFVGTAASAEPEWRRWFAFEKYSALGYARNDVLYREPSPDDLIGADKTAYEAMRRARLQGRRVVLYAPTFRDADTRWMHGAHLPQVAAAMQESGALLAIQLHPRDSAQAAELGSALAGAVMVTPRTDIAPLLREASVLVTDYSSVMFDFLHMDRPIVLYRPDHEAYVSRSRALFDGKLASLPGPVVSDTTALAATLTDPNWGQLPEHTHTRQNLRTSLFDYRDGRSATRLMGLLEEQMQAALTTGSQPWPATMHAPA